MTIDELRKTEAIQAHHFQAAKWFTEQVLFASPKVKLIGLRCREYEATTRNFGIDSFNLLHRAAVARETISNDIKVIGVLREILNIVHRESTLN